MIIQNRSFGTYSIDKNGNFSVGAEWRLRQEAPEEGAAALYEAARVWAGNVGEPFRVPTPEGGFTLSEELKVSSVSFKELEGGGLVVAYQAEPATGPELLGEVTEKIDRDGVRTRSASWSVPLVSADPENPEEPELPASGEPEESLLWPVPGTVLDWEGGAFVCESCEIKTNRLGQQAEVTVSAREVSILQLGGITDSRSADGERQRSVKFFVTDAELETFLWKYPLGFQAEWAGGRFYCDKIDTSPYGVIGNEVTLTAREIYTHLVSASRSEEFVSFSRSGGVRRQIVWTGVYQVMATEVFKFYKLTGTDASGWSEPNCIVTRVTPVRKSDIEYQVTVEAQHRNNPGLFENYTASDRSDLGGRRDIRADMCEFRVTPEQAGYQLAANGGREAIPGWSASSRCPFRSSGKLAENLVGAILHTLVVTVTTYHRGSASGVLEDMAGWTGSRVLTGEVADYTGSYLKVRQNCDETCDDAGDQYTRLTRSYQLAPNGFEWNPGYWDRH